MTSRHLLCREEAATIEWLPWKMLETWHASLLIMPSPSLLSVMTGHRLAYEESSILWVVHKGQDTEGLQLV